MLIPKGIIFIPCLNKYLPNEEAYFVNKIQKNFKPENLKSKTWK